MRALTEIPGPAGLPLLGNLLELDLKQLHRVLERWAHAHGTVYRYSLAGKPVVVIADHELIQSILRQRPKVYRRLGNIESVFREMGIIGVFSSEGEDWKRQRRMIAHALDAQHLRQFFPTLIKVTERLRRRWEAAADQGTAVDVQQDLMRYSVDVTASLAFGSDMNTLETDGDVIQHHLDKFFPTLNRRVNAVFPYWRYFKLPADREFDRSLPFIRSTIEGFIARTRAHLAEHPELAEHPTNLLEALVAARDEGDASFTDEEVFGNVLTILLGGEDTTANTLAWMLDYVSVVPEIQKRAREEAVGLVGARGMLREAGDAEKLPYIEGVTHEAMRLKPVGPVHFVEPLEDVVVGDAAIPKGTAMMLLVMHGGMQDANFGAAGEFRPERWMETTPATGCPHNPRAFMPFGAGPRFCPGRQLAMLEIKTVMAMLSSTFEVSKVQTEKPVTELFSFTMLPQNLLVRFKRL